MSSIDPGSCDFRLPKIRESEGFLQNESVRQPGRKYSGKAGCLIAGAKRTEPDS
jgi:hypothetical protein